MPIYTYRCTLCGYSDEIIQGIGKRNKPMPCVQEGCSGVMIRVLDIFSFQLKGGGWAKDGYGKKQKKEEKKE